LLRKQALYIFWGSLALSIVATMRAPTRAWLAVNRAAEVGILMGWAIPVAVCFYLAKLGKARILH
jgi:hypothetical protein